jgi:hypothetical protein
LYLSGLYKTLLNITSCFAFDCILKLSARISIDNDASFKTDRIVISEEGYTCFFDFYVEEICEMKSVKYLALLSTFALLFSLSAFARDKNQHSVDIPDTLQVGSTQLQPGTYKVEWQGTGPSVQVTFLQNGKAVATVPGTLTSNKDQPAQNDIVTDTTSSNTKTLAKIDIGHDTLAFEQSGM